jgi:hypothetical protein
VPGTMLLAKGGVTRNGVEHLISIDNATNAPAPDDIEVSDADEEMEEEVEIAAVPKQRTDERISAIEESFIMTDSAPSEKTSKNKRSAPPAEKPAKSTPKPAPAEKPATVDNVEF